MTVWYNARRYWVYELSPGYTHLAAECFDPEASAARCGFGRVVR